MHYILESFSVIAVLPVHMASLFFSLTDIEWNKKVFRKLTFVESELLSLIPVY